MLQAQLQEHGSDLSPMQYWQRHCTDKPRIQVWIRASRICDCQRDTRGWKLPPTYSIEIQRKEELQGPQLLRLSDWSAWRLQSLQEAQGLGQLLSQGGRISHCIWRYQRGLYLPGGTTEYYLEGSYEEAIRSQAQKLFIRQPESKARLGELSEHTGSKAI